MQFFDGQIKLRFLQINILTVILSILAFEFKSYEYEIMVLSQYKKSFINDIVLVFL